MILSGLKIKIDVLGLYIEAYENLQEHYGYNFNQTKSMEI